MQLRDVEPGTVVTLPLLGGLEKYTVQSVEGPISDIPIKDEQGDRVSGSLPDPSRSCKKGQP
jgi:hypothetical protein